MKAVFPPCLIQTGRKLTFIWNFVAFSFREGPAWNLCCIPVHASDFPASGRRLLNRPGRGPGRAEEALVKF